MSAGPGFAAIDAPPEVDIPTAKEVIEQIHTHLSVAEREDLVRELAGKVASVRRLLLSEALDASGVRSALEWTFVARRRASAVLGTRDDSVLAAWVGDLLDGGEPVAVRFDRFCSAAGPLPPAAAAELASELLHFAWPERHWMWARWMWNADSRTGALPLLIGEEYELEVDGAGGLGASYERVCAALDVLDASPEAAAFRLQGGGRLATDVLLACTYGVYMRTVLGLKMTNEFNALVPPMGQLVRRLLGVHRGAGGRACP
jgi:hypothetical protein